MAVPSTAADLSTTASSNSPAGSESIGTSLDDYMRAFQAILKQENSRGADTASASSVTIPSAGKYFVITGTTGITSFADSWTGRTVYLKFSDAVLLTHSSGLILPGSANITTAAGDVFGFNNESAGVWRCTFYQPATGYQNKIVQVIEATPIATVVTCNTAIPLDNSIPQNTEGDQVITASITPTSASNRLRIEFDCSSVSHTNGAGGSYVITGLFQDTTAGALAASCSSLDGGAAIGKTSLCHEMAAGTTSATTFKIRIGPHTGGITLYVNGDTTGTRLFGGIGCARLRVTEIKV